MKKYRYSLNGVINGESYKANRAFSTRNKAIDHMLKVCERKYSDAEIEDEESFSKHDIEYTLNHDSSFRIARI